MTEPAQPAPPGEPRPVTPASRRKLWQVGIRTLVLFMAAIAVWITYSINRRENAALESRIQALRPLARELAIDDPAKIAVVKRMEYWYDENGWEIYLPEGTYRVCLATRKIDEEGLVPPSKSATIGAGRHRLFIEQAPDGDNPRVTVSWDGKKRLEVTESKGWYPGQGSIGGGEYSNSTQLPADQPAVLFRRRFLPNSPTGQMTASGEPTEGVLLWIERADSPKP